MAHCLLSEIKCRKKKHPDVPGMYSTSALSPASGYHNAANRPSVVRTLCRGTLCQTNPDKNISHSPKQEGLFLRIHDAIGEAIVSFWCTIFFAKPDLLAMISKKYKKHLTNPTVFGISPPRSVGFNRWIPWLGSSVG